MNRNQRRLGRMHQRWNFVHDDDRRGQNSKCNCDSVAELQELQEVLSPKTWPMPFMVDRFTKNKCCYVAPMQEDFSQLTDIDEQSDKYESLIQEQYGFNPLDPLNPDNINQLNELRRAMCNKDQVENSSQHCTAMKLSSPQMEEVTDDSPWQKVENADEIDKYINQNNDSCLYMPNNIHICEIPRIKIIAKKFSRLKKNNVELRRLDEKVVCVEYDVYIGDCSKPKEKLRAFFSIRPVYGKESQEEPTSVNQGPETENNSKISNDELKKLNEKEIEIIDEKIYENKTYLQDLKRILKRTQAINNKKNKDTLDLMSLYEMARRESPPLDDEFSTANFLSKAELQEMKDLILSKCVSSVHGVRRRTVRSSDVTSFNVNGISQSIMAEVCRSNDSNE